MKVRLPSDSLTPAQLRQKNSAVIEYNLSKPMTYEQLLQLPQDLRKRYLDGLVAEYNANQRALAEMLGVHRQTLCRRCKEWDVTFPQGAAAIMRPDQVIQWRAFCAGQEIQVTEAPRDKYKDAPVEAAPDEPAPQITKAPEPAGAKMQAGHMVFHGSAGAAMRQVYDLLGETPCTITIAWQFEEADENVQI